MGHLHDPLNAFIHSQDLQLYWLAVSILLANSDTVAYSTVMSCYMITAILLHVVFELRTTGSYS